MAVEHIHTYLVHPGKRSDNPPQIGGTAIPLKGKLFELLDAIYSTSDNDCNIDISFNPNPDGTQQNPCRDLVVDYLGGPTLAQGSRIASD